MSSSFVSGLQVDQMPGSLKVKVVFTLPSETCDKVIIYRRTDMFYYNIYDQSTAYKLYENTTPFEDVSKTITIYDDTVVGDIVYYYSAVTFRGTNTYCSESNKKSIAVISLFGFEQQFYSLMPITDQENDKEKQELYKFVKVIAKIFEYTYSKTKAFQYLLDINTAPTEFLRYISEEIDWELDKELPLNLHRILTKNASYFYKWSGTLKGIEAIAKTLGATGVSVSKGYRYFLVFIENILLIDPRPYEWSPEIVRRYIQKLTPIFCTFDIAYIERLSEKYKDWYLSTKGLEFKDSDRYRMSSSWAINEHTYGYSQDCFILNESVFNELSSLDYKLKDELNKVKLKLFEDVDFMSNNELQSFIFNETVFNEEEFSGLIRDQGKGELWELVGGVWTLTESRTF